MMKRQHWFHCSRWDHGETFVARKRVPHTTAEKESPVPRLCVAPTVAACFSSMLFIGGPVSVYRTSKPCRGVMPRGVWDQVVTRERWLIPPVEMIRVRIIDAATVAKAQQDIVTFHRMANSRSDLWLRVAQYAIAADVFGADEPEQRHIRRAVRITKIGDPQDYIIGRLLSSLQNGDESA